MSSEQVIDSVVSAVAKSDGSVKSAWRALDVLEALAADGQLSLSELQMALKIPKSSMHALLKTLVKTGWVETDAQGRFYRIGLRSLRIATAFLDRDVAVRLAGPLMVELREQLDETVHLGRLDGGDVVYLASKESSHYGRSVSRIGRRLPAYATGIGQILLAMRSTEALHEILPEHLTRLTPNTIVKRSDLETELAKDRERGYSFESGQNTPGLACFAVVVPGTFPAVDAISCSLPVSAVSDTTAIRVVNSLTACAEQLGQLLRSNGW